MEREMKLTYNEKITILENKYAVEIKDLNDYIARMNYEHDKRRSPVPALEANTAVTNRVQSARAGAESVAYTAEIVPNASKGYYIKEIERLSRELREKDVLF